MSGNEPIQVDTDKLKQAAYNLLQVQQHVQSATSSFIQDCNDNSGAIGDDKAGQKFHENFDGDEEGLIQAGSDNGQLLERISGEVQQLIRALDNVEQTAAETGQRLNVDINNG